MARPVSPAAQQPASATLAEEAKKVFSWLSSNASTVSQQVSKSLLDPGPTSSSRPNEPSTGPAGASERTAGFGSSDFAASNRTLTAAIRNSVSLALTFSGRTGRAEYWYFTLALVAAWFILLPVFTGMSDVAVAVTILVLISIPNIAASVRRLHDIDRSGYWVLLGLIPWINFVGAFVLIYFLAQPGEQHENRFGPPPA